MKKGPPPQLVSARTALYELHRLLLSVLKKTREKEMGKVMNATEWFHALLNAPEYQWLKPLNSLLSDVDALSDSGRAASDDLAILRAELEKFFFKENGDATSFNYHYRKLFAHNHDVMYSHGHLKIAFADLPQTLLPPNPDEVRLGWHKTGASKRKLLN